MKGNATKSLFLRFALAVGLLALTAGLFLLPERQAEAAATTMSNLIVFVKGAGDADDTLAQGADEIMAAYQNEFNGYFRTVSDGALTVVNIFPQAAPDGVTPFVLRLAAGEYTDSTQIVSEVVGLLDAMNIDWSGDNDVDRLSAGIVDNLTILFQTDTVQTQGGVLYPHKGVSGDASGLTGDGSLVVRNYNVIDSQTMLDTSAATGALYCNGYDVAIHEFYHTLGLPDLYYYNSDGKPVGEWCVMATGQMLRYPLSFFRQQLGWLSAQTVTATGTYTLHAVSASSGTRLIKIQTPLSNSEYFLLEYRVKGEMGQIDHKIPSSGLLAYRVDETVDNHTNAAGGNYVYIFRPGNESVNDVSTSNMAHPEYAGVLHNNAANAAILPPGETAYGSTDLSADPTESDLIYYADGGNSGVAISNATLSEDGQSITFDLTFADYTVSDLWQLHGDGTVGAGSSTPSLAVFSGSVYAAATEYDDENFTASAWVRRWTGTAWEQVGSAIGNLYDPQLRAYGGNLYLLGGLGNNYNPTVYRLNGSAWQKLSWTDNTAGASLLRFVESDGGLYYYMVAGDPNRLYVRNALTNADALGGQVLQCGAGRFLANPAVCEANGAFYIAHTDYAGSASDLGYIARYTAADGLDTDFGTSGAGGANGHNVYYDGGKVYALFNGGTPTLAVYDEAAQTWEKETLSFLPAGYAGLQLIVSGGTPYILYIDASQAVHVYCRTGSGWSQHGQNAFRSVDRASMLLSGDTIYVAGGAATTGVVSVRCKALAAAAPTPTPTASSTASDSPTPSGETPTPTEDPTPPASHDYTVRLTPPDGYTDTTVWIDGRSYTAAVGGGQYAVTLSNGDATNAVLYRYNQNSIPVGMYVYRLRHENGAYTVIPLPNLEDLLSYHGFSIRVKGVSGIRFKTGISTALRPRLLSAAGVDGYRLVEYGTLVMRGSNLGTFPLILGGDRTSSGKAYWMERGQVKDMIFETKDGRHRFTSVLTRLPATEYRTDFAFRGYIILQKDGERITLYGPIMSRSIYRIAEQVIASGEFAPDSAAGRYVQSILTNAQ